ncbi:MAG TPA: hypothetical protein VFF52_30380 [Isosphaeraceae bacterium]|nr:hypothetical protein [Isosphaeraceae bacterium]
MPSRVISLVILVYWSIAAFCLLTWDVLPELTLGYPPDLRAIAYAGDSIKPVRWSLQVIDDPRAPEARRTVGEAVTSSTRQPDGWYEMTSRVEFDAGGLLRGTLFSSRESFPLRIDSVYQIDPSGNLHNLDLGVRSRELDDELVHVIGQLKGKRLEILSQGKLPILNQRFSFEYEPRSVVQDVLGPLDRLPGLHVGQRWESRVINPFTQQADLVRVEVARRTMIHWDGEPVSTFEVVQHLGSMSPRTWVRLDGVILRQEVPVPFVRLVLERRPEESTVAPPASATGRRVP